VGQSQPDVHQLASGNCSVSLFAWCAH